LGVYCIPRESNISVWDCIIFLRKGLYQHAKFKFLLTFPKTYPKICPEITFISHVYHPLVEPTTGKLDTKLMQPPWGKPEPIGYNLFAWIKTIFHDP